MSRDAALRDVLGLIFNHPAPLILYFLFFIVLAIAAIVTGFAAACLTCCIAAIPYVGTVILLPIPRNPVCVHAFIPSAIWRRIRCVGRKVAV